MKITTKRYKKADLCFELMWDNRPKYLWRWAPNAITKLLVIESQKPSVYKTLQSLCNSFSEI